MANLHGIDAAGEDGQLDGAVGGRGTEHLLAIQAVDGHGGTVAALDVERAALERHLHELAGQIGNGGIDLQDVQQTFVGVNLTVAVGVVGVSEEPILATFSITDAWVIHELMAEMML